MSSPDYIVDCLDAKALYRIKDDWGALFSRAPDAFPYLSFSWINTFITCGQINGDVRVLIARQDEVFVAALPLMIKKYGIARVAYPIGTGVPAYLGVLADPEHLSAVVRIVDYIKDYKLFDVYYFNNYYARDSATKILFNCLEKCGYIVKSTVRNPCYFIELPQSFDDYLQKTKSTKRAKKLKYEEKRLYAEYDVQILYYKGNDISDAVFDRVVTIQNESWMRRRGAAVIGQPFNRTLLMTMAQEGLAHLWLMTLNGEDAAFVFALVHAHQFHYYRTAFKLKFEDRSSVGKMLTMHVIRQACQMGFKYFDFGHGEAEYKRFWATDFNHVCRIAAGQGFRGRMYVFFCSMIWKISKIKWLRSMYRTFAKMVKMAKNQAGPVDISRGVE